MKIRFDEGDLKRFLIYAGILFIFVVIGISVIISFSKNGNFENINFFIAFSSDYLKGTFVVYILLLLGLVSSTKTKFFQFEKGFGFTTEKKLDGYSNWCDVKTMKKELSEVVAIEPKAKAGGIPLINNGKKLWVDDSEYHNLIMIFTIIYP